MTTNMWLLILFIGEFITGCVGYSLGRSNKPKKSISDKQCVDDISFGKSFRCKGFVKGCKNELCNRHCASREYECNCRILTEVETEILEEVKQITRG